MADKTFENSEEKGQTFPVMINNRLRSLRTRYDDDNRYLVAECVTMVRRDRSDYFGNFDEQWLDSRHPLQLTWKPQLAKGMVTYPVIRRSVNAKISTELATTIKLAVEPVRKDPETEAGAKKAERIVSYFRRKIWDPQFDYNQSKMRQLGRLAYVYISSDKDEGVEIKFPKTVDKPRAYGNFHLDCPTCGREITPEEVGITDPVEAAQGRLDDAFDNHGKAQTGAAMAKLPQPNYDGVYAKAAQPEPLESELFCPVCAEAGKQSALSPVADDFGYRMEPYHDGTYDKSPTGTIEGRLVSHLNTRIDEFNAIGFKFKRAHWFNYRFLMPTYQLEKMAADDEVKKGKIRGRSSNDWSDAVRWSYELTKKFGNAVPDSSDTRISHLTEVELWWFQPVACGGWKNGDAAYTVGKWTLPPNAEIAESFAKDDFKGLGLMVCGEEILKVFNEDFRKKWFGIAWTPDPYAFFPQGEERLLHLQDATTRVFTFIYSFSQRSAAPRTVANRLHFNPTDLEAHVVGGIILSKTNAKAPEMLDLRKHIFNLPAGDLPAMMQYFVELIITVVKEETGIYDETVGAGNKDNKTARGRETSLNRSLGLQLPQMQSKGDGLTEFAALVLEHAQEMEDAFFYLFTDEDEEEWTTQDIETFRALNIRKELNISVVEGSDIPRTREELEEAYLAAIQEGLFDPNNPTPTEIRSIILKIRGIDYDLDDYNSNTRVANIRYDAIKEKLKGVNPGDAIVMMPVLDPMSGKPAMQIDPHTGQPGEAILEPQLNPKLIADLMQDPKTQPQEFADNHFIFINFFKRKLYGVIAARQVDAIKVLVINNYITAHRGYIGAEISRQMAMSGGPAGGGDPNAEAAPGKPNQNGKPPQKTGQPQKGSTQNAK